MARKAKVVEAPVKPATTREVREWLQENGFEVKDRGRIKAELLAAFTEKTGRPLVDA